MSHEYEVEWRFGDGIRLGFGRCFIDLDSLGLDLFPGELRGLDPYDLETVGTQLCEENSVPAAQVANLR